MKRYIKSTSENGRKDAELLATDGSWELWTPHTFEASIYLARKGADRDHWARWDTAYIGNGSRYFDQFTRKGPLYIFINKADPTDKYQYHAETNSFYDWNDRPADFESFICEHPAFAEFFGIDCNDVEACDKVVASEYTPYRHDFDTIVGIILEFLHSHDKVSQTELYNYLAEAGFSNIDSEAVGKAWDRALAIYEASPRIEACNKVTASTKPHPPIPAGWEKVSEGDDDEGNWGTIYKELPNNGGYIWLDLLYDDNDRRYYELQIGYRNSDGTIGDIHPLISKEFYRLGDAVKYAQDRINRESNSEEDIESCSTITADSQSTASLMSPYADALTSLGYDGKKFLNEVSSEYTCNELNDADDLHACICGFILNSDYINQEDANKLADDVINKVGNINACDKVTAYTHRYSAGRIEDDGTEDFYYDTGFDSYDEACDWGINHDCTHIYDRERDEFVPINSCDTKYFANMVSASNDPELDDNFLIEGYYDNQRRGLAESAETSDVSALNELANEYANKGYYIVVHNLTDGVITEFSADNWFNDIAPDGGAELFMSW